MNISQHEIARYLGYHGYTPDSTIQSIIDEILRQLLSRCTPRFIYRTEELTLGPNYHVNLGCLQTVSQDLTRNLKDCSRVILLAATLGTVPDFMIRRFEKTDMVRAVVTQACSAAMIEAYLNEQQALLAQTLHEDGWYMHPRFSPGYGDFSLNVQPAFIAVLQTAKRIGVTLTDGMLMMPSKSVTAVIGLSRKPLFCHTRGCKDCNTIHCDYRRSEE